MNTVKSSRMPECLRRCCVAVKRRPSMIALSVLIIAFLQYSMNLTHISNTTARVQGSGMGLCGFVTMLFSILSLVCCLNAFPRRKKPVIPMVVLMFIMFALIIVCDIRYRDLIMTALMRAEDPIRLDASTAYIADAYNALQDHIFLEGAGAVLVALMPIYSGLLGKINTSVIVEDNDRIGGIERDERREQEDAEG